MRYGAESVRRDKTAVLSRSWKFRCLNLVMFLSVFLPVERKKASVVAS